MNRSWYIWGFSVILFAIVAFQLIWLPAPYFFGKEKEWIAYIDWIYYAVMIIPLCWLVGGIVRSKQNLQSKLGITIVRSLAMAGSIGMLVILSQPLQHLMLLIAVTAITIGLILIELFWCKSIIIKHNTYIKSAQLRPSYQSLIKPIFVYIIILLFLLCPTPYNVTYPAMTMNMNAYATIGQHEGENGIIEGVLVFERPAFPVDWLYQLIFPAYSINRQAENEPSIMETYSEVVEMKLNANQLAAAVAWERAGLGDAVIFDGIQVMAIVANSPADGKVQAGDIITSINGRAVKNAQGFISYMSDSVQVGDQVQLTVKRDGQKLALNVTTESSPEIEDRPVIGISIQNAYTTHIDEELVFKSYLAHAGGPSHGAMLTLAFLDQLTDEDLTGGLKIAGTGTIEPDGTVGMVGGIPQKAYAVSLTDADVFFVPKEGMLDATMAAPNLRIVPVTSILDILNWIEGNKVKLEGNASTI